MAIQPSKTPSQSNPHVFMQVLCRREIKMTHGVCAIKLFNCMTQNTCFKLYNLLVYLVDHKFTGHINVLSKRKLQL